MTIKTSVYAVGAALAVLSLSSAFAENPLGAMAVGGTMRDAENRALDVPAPAKESAAPKLTASGQEKPAEQSAEDVRVLGVVESVRVFGSTNFAERVGLADRLLAALGTNDAARTVGEVTAAIASVRAELLDEGYYLVRLSLSRSKPYDVETRTLGVLADEGRFGNVAISFLNDDGERVEDGFWFSRDQINTRFARIEPGDTFDYSRLRGLLFDVNSHPDLTVDTSIDVRKPIEGEGDDRRITRYADLDLAVHESCPIHGMLEFNNYGMEEINEWQTALTLQYLNLTKHDDTLTISPSMSMGAEMMSVAGSYMLPHHWWLGGNTTIYGGWSYLEVDDVVPQLGLEGTGYFGGIQHSENIYDSDRHLWLVSAGLLWRYISDQYSAYNVTLQERGVSILPLSLALSYTGKKADFVGGRNFLTVQGLYNLTTTGDDIDQMWTDAEENYWIFRGQVARLQPLFGWFDETTKQDLHQWMLFVKLEGQYSGDVLIPVEKLSMGGYNAMRGYRTRGYLGDWGGYGTVEVRTPLLVDPISAIFSDRTNKSPIDRLQFLAFCDYGYTAFNDLPSGYDDSTFLCSGGLGVRFALTQHFQIKFDWAIPFVDTDWAEDNDSEFYLSAQLQF